MRLDLRDVSAAGTFELPGDGDIVNVVEVESLAEASGLVEVSGGVTTLTDVRAASGRVSGLRWVAGPLRINGEGPIDIGELALWGEFGPAPAEGEPDAPVRPAMKITAASLRGAVTLQSEGAGLTGALAAEGITITLTGDDLTIAVERATLTELHATFDGGRVTTAAVIIEGLEVTADRMRLESVSTEEAAIEIDDLAAMVFAEPPEPAEASPHEIDLAAEPAPRSGPSLDVHFLDYLNGQLDVDLSLDITVPVIGRRRATHHFRIPVQAGALNYKELERDLSALEESVLDIRLREDRLTLEKGIPLIPILFHKPILYWPLTPEEVTLARRQLVRMRTLLNWRVPAERKDDQQPPSVVLRRLELHNTDVEMALGGPTAIDLGRAGRILLGSEEEPAIKNLWIRGEIVHKPGAEPVPTELRLGASGLNLGVYHLHVGAPSIDAFLHADSLHEVTLAFRDLRPGRFAGTARGLRLSGVRVDL